MSQLESKTQYTIIKDLPDAKAGTLVMWGEKSNSYYYEKSTWIGTSRYNFLSRKEVEKNPEYFQQYSKKLSVTCPVDARRALRSLWKNQIFREKNPALPLAIESEEKFLLNYLLGNEH